MHLASEINYKLSKTLHINNTKILFTCVSQQVHFTPRESSIDVKLKSTVGTLLPEKKERQNGDGRLKADL